MTYCTEEEVTAIFGDISDDVPEALVELSITNSKVWVDSNLKKNRIPIPQNVPDTLQTVAVYYAASDILLSLYHGDELPVQYDVWFNKAQGLLEDYIDEYYNSDAEASEVVNHQMVKHSHGRTYNQKRHRRSVRGWVR